VVIVRVVTFKADEELIEKLNHLAQTKGVTRSEIIRRAIELYLKLEDHRAKQKPKIVRLTS
jgi:predicted transcriptional regulator